MARRRNTTCFNCGLASTVSIQSKEIKGLRYICPDPKCWKVYYKEADQKKKEK